MILSYHPTEEVRQDISAKTKEAMWRPDVRQRYLEGLAKRDVSGSTRAAMARPDVKERHRLGCKNRKVSEEGRRLQSIAQKKRFLWDEPASKRPEVAKKISIALTGRKMSEEAILKMSYTGRFKADMMTEEERKDRFGKHNVGRSSWNKGIPQTDVVKKKLSKALAEKYANDEMPVLDTHCEYNGRWFRSTWERKFAIWCDERKIRWKYQPGFFYTSIGYYVPDFKLLDFGEFVEVKGRYDDECVRKMDEFVLNGNVLRIIDKWNIDDIHLDKMWIPTTD